MRAGPGSRNVGGTDIGEGGPWGADRHGDCIRRELQEFHTLRHNTRDRAADGAGQYGGRETEVPM